METLWDNKYIAFLLGEIADTVIGYLFLQPYFIPFLHDSLALAPQAFQFL